MTAESVEELPLFVIQEILDDNAGLNDQTVFPLLVYLIGAVMSIVRLLVLSVHRLIIITGGITVAVYLGRFIGFSLHTLADRVHNSSRDDLVSLSLGVVSNDVLNGVVDDGIEIIDRLLLVITIAVVVLFALWVVKHVHDYLLRKTPERFLRDWHDFVAAWDQLGLVKALQCVFWWQIGHGGTFHSAHRGHWWSMLPCIIRRGVLVGQRLLAQASKHDVRILRNRGPVMDHRQVLRRVRYSTNGITVHHRVISDSVYRSVTGRFAALRAVVDPAQIGVQVDKEMLNVNLHESVHASVAAATTEVAVAYLLISGKC